MKLRYYLRGLGVGIVVTALILGLSGGEKENLSDAEIKERAAALGMVDTNSLTLAALQTQNTETVSTGDDKEAAGEEETTASTEGTTALTEETATSTEETAASTGETAASTEETAASTGETAAMASSEEVGEEEAVLNSSETGNVENQEGDHADGETRTIVIENGDSSVAVSRMLEEAGLIEDAGRFDTYLCSLGYGKSIDVGTYEIPVGSSMEEIVKIICRKQ